MNKKIGSKKLQLAKETLRSLSPGELEQAAGGSYSPNEALEPGNGHSLAAQSAVVVCGIPVHGGGLASKPGICYGGGPIFMGDGP